MKQRFFVTVRAPDGLLLVNKLMCDCETEKQAVRAAKRAAVESIDSWDSPTTIPLFVGQLQIEVERQA